MTAATIQLLCAALTVVGEPAQPARYGYLNEPSYHKSKHAHTPQTVYQPQPGDVLLFSNPTPIWSMLYMIALTGAPGHSGLVVRLDDGELGIVEAGFNDKPWVRVIPLDCRLPAYKGCIWVRTRKHPVNAEQSLALTEFARMIDGRRYGVGRLLLQMTPLRNRGPLRTEFLGKPHGIRDTYICSEAVLEGLVIAGILDAETTRPSATYPRDLFFDRSMNLYVNRHRPLACDWDPPALWRQSLCP